MAKCKHFKSEAEGTNSRGMACRFECPKGADSLCNVRKPKSKLKRFKGWAYILKDESVSVCQNRVLAHTTPCTILIDEKYLKGKVKK